MVKPGALADVYETELFTAPGSRSGTPPRLLIEVPHGATGRRHFLATRRRLSGDLPEDLEAFFHVNTDVGSVECARWVARMVTDPGAHPDLKRLPQPGGGSSFRGLESVLILRGLVARTFIDLNRVISGRPESRLEEGLTPGIPGYVTDPGDIRALVEMHGAYQAAARQSFESVFAAGGRGLILHTYAPRSIHLDGIDGDVVTALRRAYEPGLYESWPLRPDVDLISETATGERLAPARLVDAVRRCYGEVGIEAAENATYRLHESTMGYLHSARHPGRVLCLEINRARLADPFKPFVPMSINDRKARRMAAPLAAALLSTA